MTYPIMTIPETYSSKVRIELRKIPTWKLRQVYIALEDNQAIGIEVIDANQAYALSAIKEILWERGAFACSSKNPGKQIVFPVI